MTPSVKMLSTTTSMLAAMPTFQLVEMMNALLDALLTGLRTAFAMIRATTTPATMMVEIANQRDNAPRVAKRDGLVMEPATNFASLKNATGTTAIVMVARMNVLLAALTTGLVMASVTTNATLNPVASMMATVPNVLQDALSQSKETASVTKPATTRTASLTTAIVLQNAPRAAQTDGLVMVSAISPAMSKNATSMKETASKQPTPTNLEPPLKKTVPKGCPPHFINDGFCDEACDIPECDFDGDDCVPVCADGCLQGWPGDGVCDKACDVEACNFDEGDCENNNDKYCSKGCPYTWINDEYCDEACLVPECDYDGNDCDGIDGGGDGLPDEFLELDVEGWCAAIL